MPPNFFWLGAINRTSCQRGGRARDWDVGNGALFRFQCRHERCEQLYDRSTGTPYSWKHIQQGRHRQQISPADTPYSQKRFWWRRRRKGGCSSTVALWKEHELCKVAGLYWLTLGTPAMDLSAMLPFYYVLMGTPRHCQKYVTTSSLGKRALRQIAGFTGLRQGAVIKVV